MLKAVILVCLLAFVPANASAQAGLAGVVTDSSGGALAGVLVDAASPALIERHRSTYTDGTGRYRLEDLRPGVYAVTFSLPGWARFRQEAVQLTGSATVTVNAQLSLGALSDVITVSVSPPAIDLNSTTQQVALSGELIRAMPTIRSYNALVALVPGVLTSTNDVITATATVSFPAHGGRVNEGRLMLDGFTVGSPPSGNSATSYAVDLGTAHEVTFSAGGASGEFETGGLVMNIIPRTGGNVARGTFYVGGSSRHFQADNLTPELRAQGVAAATPLSEVYDISGTLGGPILRNRLWYFAAAHTGGSTKESVNVYDNVNAGKADEWLYVPDRSRRSYSDRTFENVSGRLTWQLSSRHKIAAFWDAQSLCRNCTGATPGLSEPQRVSPEAVGVLGRPLHVTQATWSWVWSDHLVAEAGYGGTYFGVGNFEREPNPTRDLIRVVEQCAAGCDANGGIPGLTYRSQDYSVAYTGSYLWKGSIVYAAGAHLFKVGYQHTLMTDDRTWSTNTQNLTYRVSNGVPNQLTQSISPWVNNARVAWAALYVQEQWTRGRLTLEGALRFDRAHSWFPAQQQGPSRFLPTPLTIPETRGVDSYKDLTPRLGAVYDLMGNGRTVTKVSWGRYLEGAGVSGAYANTNPSLRMPQTTPVFGPAGVTRAWTDANRNFVADCDLRDPSAQDLRSGGGDLCGSLSNTQFGSNVLTNSFSPNVLDGWGVRPADTSLSVSFEQEIAPRVTATVVYHHRSFDGFTVVDNRALESPDLTPFSVVAPVDSRLPGGGGYVVSGLYDVVPEKAGEVQNLVTAAGDYGRWTQAFDGLDVIGSVRAGSFTFTGGMSTGRTTTDNCGVRAALPELSTATTGTSVFGAGLMGSAVTPLSPYCKVDSGLLTQFRGLSSYLVPKLGVQLSATLQSKPGTMLAANYAVPNSVVAPALGRNLSGNAANVTVNLVTPGTMYGDRINELDVRIGKVLHVGRTRSTVAVEIYNALNSSAVLTYNMAYVPGGTWLQPMTVLTPRFFKLTAEIEF